MRPPRIARTTGAFAWAARRTQQDRLLGGVPGSERGSVALGVAIVALTTRSYPHPHSHTTGTTMGLIVFIMIVILVMAFWFIRNRMS
jgi:hypothetical protein